MAAAMIVQLGTFMVYALFGAATRTLFGIYKSYTSSPKAKIKILWKRVAIEIVASMFFGSFSAILLQEIGAFEYSQILAAVIAGFLGADLITLISRKVGLTSSMKIMVTKEQMDMLGFNARQRKALEYLNEHGTITNDVYQELNKTSHRSASNDLTRLAKSNKIKKHGIGKGTYYTI
jgi:hypothetical protein